MAYLLEIGQNPFRYSDAQKQAPPWLRFRQVSFLRDYSRVSCVSWGGSGTSPYRSSYVVRECERCELGRHGTPPVLGRVLGGAPTHFLLRELRREHINGVDLRRLAQQLRRVGHQRLRDGASEVGLAAVLVGEGVEHAEGRRTELQREPHRGACFL